MANNTEIAQYYNSSQFYYTHFWSSTALHYGFWYEDTKSLAEAIANTNRFVVERLVIDNHDTVLDAGCGVGGSGIYIAENTGATVEGITLSEVQLRIAEAKIAQSPASRLLNVSIQDYTATNFGDGNFTKLFGIESICHANNKRDFLAEAYRILKPGGRIAIVDIFLAKSHLSAEEHYSYRRVIEGWLLPDLSTCDGFRQVLKQVGFKHIKFYDMQRYIGNSILRIHCLGLVTGPINRIMSRLGLARENLASRYQKALCDSGAVVYGVFVAERASEHLS